MEEVEVRLSPTILSSNGTGGATGSRAPRPGVESGAVGQRIVRELHDTVKQNLCGATMMIEACVEAQGRDEDPSVVRELLARALEMAREAERELSKPLEELGLSCPGGPAPTAFLRERFERLGRDFGIETHESLEAPLETLSRARITTVCRVCIEASWNAARHSGAKNLWLESRLTGDAFILALRDDGRGFSAEEAAGGLGLSSMRSRAEEAGGALEVLSAPGEGTTVRLRLPVRRGRR